MCRISKTKCLFVLWSACATFAFAQSDPPPVAAQPTQEYQGPSILSRDRTLVGERGGKLIDFRLYASLTGVYDSGLTAVATDSKGNLLNTSGSEGIEVGFGADGSKTWRRDSISLDYAGSYRHYTNNSYFDGTNQFLNLRYGRILTRRISLDVKETAGITSLSNGAFSYLPLTTNDLVAVPANELFDNTTYYTQTRGTLIWQKTARLSFSAGGDAYAVRRRSTALAGLTGYGAHADVAYRITKRQTVNLSYNYTHYEEQRVFGYANLHTSAAGYSLGLGRQYDFSISLGASYLDYRGLETVNVDPAIVAIIGQATVTANFHRYSVVPYGQLRVIRRFQRSSFSLDASAGISPGNGVYLTSRQNTVGASYSLNGIRRWTIGARFNYSSLSTLGQTLGKYDNYQGGGGATYRLNNYVHVEGRYDYRHYTTQNAVYQKDSNRVSIGLAFSPGDKPLSIW
jgi:hypothetical protein